MSNFLNIPKVLPFQFVENTTTPGMHINDDWAYNQIREWEKRVFYAQKWIRSYKTKLQIVCTIAPDDLKLLNNNAAAVKSFTWSIVAVGINGESVYECEYDVTTGVATDGIYYLYQKNELLGTKFEAISEPILIRNYHRNVRPWVYSHNENAYGVVWTTGIVMTFMCESDIPPVDYQPDNDRNSYDDQVHNVTTLSAYPFETMKLYIGEAPGVPPYIPIKANRILACSNVKFKDLQIERPGNAKWDINRVKGYPHVGASIEVIPAKNLDSLQLNDNVGVTPGVVLMYNLDTNFFGNGNVVMITEFEMI